MLENVEVSFIEYTSPADPLPPLPWQAGKPVLYTVVYCLYSMNIVHS